MAAPQTEVKAAPKTQEEKSAAIKFKQLVNRFLNDFETTPEAEVLAQLQETEALAAKGIFDVNKPVKPATESRFLHTAVWHQRLEIVKWLLKFGANPNAGNTKGNTPVHFACEQLRAVPPGPGQVAVGPEILKALILAGGDVTQKDNNGVDGVAKAKAKDPSFDALAYQNTLRAQQAAQSAKQADKGEDKAALLESKQKRALVASKKILKGLQLSDENIITNTLMANEDLIGEGMLVVNELKTKEGATLLHFAVTSLKPDLVKLLLKCKADPNLPDSTGETALHCACRIASQEVGRTMISYLMACGASKSLKSYVAGTTPVQCAPVEWRKWILQLNPPPLTFDAPKRPVAASAGAPFGGVSGAGGGGGGAVAGSAAVSRVPTAPTMAADGKTPARPAGAPDGLSRQSAVGNVVMDVMGKRGSLKAAGLLMTKSQAAKRKKRLSTIQTGDLKLDALWEALDRTTLASTAASDGGGFSDATIATLHESLHGCVCREGLVHDVIKVVGAVSRDNMLEFLQVMSTLCERGNRLQWDFESFALDNNGHLQDNAAELLWNATHTDSQSNTFQAYMDAMKSRNKRIIGGLSYKEFYAHLRDST